MAKVADMAKLFQLSCCLSLIAAGTAYGAEPAAVDVKVDTDKNSEYCSISDPGQKAPIKFACINHWADTPEAEEVIKIEASFAKAYVSQDYAKCGEYLADGCTTFDQGSKRLIVGKEAVLADMKRRLDKSLPDSDSPLLSYTLDHPLARVNGNKAYINCIGIKVYGGKNARTMESHSTYVFAKENGKWLRTHFTTDWQKVEPKK
jgi:hypothetical protein